MLKAPFSSALVLTGPTGSGKTTLAIDLAQRLGAEIVSMDSMALYRGMDIGTAKPTAEERRRVPHHLVDVLDPWQSSSVAWWLARAADRCKEIEARGKRVMFVGGTSLYLKALIFGLFEGPSADPAVRQRLENEAQERGTQALHDRLTRVDPAAASRIHVNDLRRIVRALEVFEVSGRPISSWQVEWREVKGAERGAPSAERQEEETLRASRSALPQILWLDVPRGELYERIERRVETMFADGLVDEARNLRILPQPLSREAAQALGYKEVFAYLDGKATLQATVQRVQIRSRQFAKRQMTWFRHLPGCRPASRELTAKLWTPTMER